MENLIVQEEIQFNQKQLNDIEQFTNANKQYCPKYVLNMDETRVEIDNFPKSSIRRKGLDGVEVKSDLNDSKSGTTYYGYYFNGSSS